MSNPQTPDVPAPRKKRTPKSAPARTGDGFSMYERAKLQIAERERKLKALQDKLMEDYTFTPHSTSNSIASSVVSSPDKVFDRLYSAETAAMRARRISPRSATNSPARPRARGTKDGYVTPTRLQELHAEGQTRLRSRKRSQQEEDEDRQRRLEEEELANCTFTPQTKWKLAAERRKKAREEAQRAADEARTRSLRPKALEREQWHKIQEEEELKKCTFKPNMKWNIAKERRNLAQQPRTIWDYDDHDADVPTQVPRTPRISTKSTNNDVSPLTDPRPTTKPTSVDQTPQHHESSEKTAAHTTNIKFVSADNFQEDTGKVTKAPTVVRSNYIGAVVPPSPEWKQKYKKIGPKQTEEILETEGSADVEATQVRSNFASTIVAGGSKTPLSKKSPMGSPKKSTTHMVAKSYVHDKVPTSHDPPMIPPLAEQEVAPPTVTPTIHSDPIETVVPPADTPITHSDPIETVVPEANESTPSKETTGRQSWLGGLLQKKGGQEQAEVATEAEQPKTIDADVDALLSSAEASASAQADALSRELADKDVAAATASAKANETSTEEQEADKKKSKVSTWKQRLLGKRSKSNDLKESTAVDDETQASRAGTENSETEARLKAEAEARLKAEEEARLKTEEARLKAEKEALLKAEQEARLRAEEEARLKAQEEALLKAEEEALLKAEEEALLKAEEEALLKAEEEALLKAEEEALLKAEEEALLKAEEEALLKAEEEALLKAEEEALLKAEEEARLRAEEEALLKAEEEALLKAEEEARLRAEEEARLKAEEEARLKAEEEARLKAEEEARLKAEEETRLKAEEEARLKAEEEARLKAEEEARLKAEEEARLKAEEEARLKAEEEARLKAEEEARLKAEEEARLKAEEEARLKAEEEARLRAEEEALLKAEEEALLKAEEEALWKAEEEALLNADEEALWKAEEEALLNADEEALFREEEEALLKAEEEALLKAEEEARLRAEEEARLKAVAEKETHELAKASSTDGGSSDDGDALSTDDDDALVSDKPKKSDRAKKWKERLARKGSRDTEKESATADVSPELVEVRLEPPTEISDAPLEHETGMHHSDEEVGGLEGDDESKHKKKSDRANKWKERLAKRTGAKGTKSKSKSGTSDESSEKVAYPRVLLNEGEDSQVQKEPEIGSI